MTYFCEQDGSSITNPHNRLCSCGFGILQVHCLSSLPVPFIEDPERTFYLPNLADMDSLDSL
jgi:hypothetical protein